MKIPQNSEKYRKFVTIVSFIRSGTKIRHFSKILAYEPGIFSRKIQKSYIGNRCSENTQKPQKDRKLVTTGSYIGSSTKIRHFFSVPDYEHGLFRHETPPPVGKKFSNVARHISQEKFPENSKNPQPRSQSPPGEFFKPRCEINALSFRNTYNMSTIELFLRSAGKFGRIFSRNSEKRC